MLKPVVAGTILLALLSACTSSEQPGQSVDSAVEKQSPPTELPGSAGVQVFIDPATGEIRDPTPAEVAALEAEKRKQAQGTKTPPPKESRQIVHPDGSVEVILDESHDQALQACMQSDGSVKMDHKCDGANQKSEDQLR